MLTFDEIADVYRDFTGNREIVVRRRAEISDDDERQLSLSCLIGHCLCVHGDESRCPCGKWRGTWRDTWHEKFKQNSIWPTKAWLLVHNCPNCSRPAWCES